MAQGALPYAGSDNVLVLGDIFVDVVLRVSHYPAEGLDAMASEVSIRQGGSSTATAIVLSKLGVRSGVIGRVGDDEFGNLVINSLRALGIKVKGIQRDPKNRTGLLFAVVSDNGERTMFAFRGANDRLSGAVRISSDWLHVSGYSLLNSPQREYSQSAVREAFRKGIPCSLDPGVRSSIECPDILKTLLPYTTVAFPSRQEIKYLFPNQDPFKAAHIMTDYGIPIVALKVDEEGSYLVDTVHQINAKIPSFRVAVRDTTGAGDAYDAGFIVGYMSGLSTVQSCILGSVVAADMIQTGRGIEGFCSSRAVIGELVSIIRTAMDDPRWSNYGSDLSVVESFLNTRRI